MPISYFAGSQAADDEPCAMDALPKVRFATDSPLEEGGFELSVPFCRAVSNRDEQPVPNLTSPIRPCISRFSQIK